jgi:dTDP-glucose 4,6-dehydratase
LAGEVINLGSSFEVSIGDTARTIAELMGTRVEIVTDDSRLRPERSEVERLWASNEKALALLGWRPHHLGLDGFRRGLTETVAWFSEPENITGYKAHLYNV